MKLGLRSLIPEKKLIAFLILFNMHFKLFHLRACSQLVIRKLWFGSCYCTIEQFKVFTFYPFNFRPFVLKIYDKITLRIRVWVRCSIWKMYMAKWRWDRWTSYKVRNVLTRYTHLSWPEVWFSGKGRFSMPTRLYKWVKKFSCKIYTICNAFLLLQRCKSTI